MSKKVNIGGDRLGSGNKITQELHDFERATHDLGFMWKSTMAPGTLVPFWTEVALPGDRFDIELDANVRTYPTVGPLFDSFKLQLDVFSCPIRLYQGKLHNNGLNIGLSMDKIKLPLVELQAKNLDFESEIPIDIQQINPSSIFSYLGINGVGVQPMEHKDVDIIKTKNALSFMMYWDILKNYYVNKQEEQGAYINATGKNKKPEIRENLVKNNLGVVVWGRDTTTPIAMQAGYRIELLYFAAPPIIDKLFFVNDSGIAIKLTDMFREHEIEKLIETYIIKFTEMRDEYIGEMIAGIHYEGIHNETDVKPTIEFFPLENLDKMRNDVLENVNTTGAFVINQNTYAPYGRTIQLDDDGHNKLRYPLQGLGLKTYQSDIFNSWMKTDWIDGQNGINSVTTIDVTDGLKIDTLILATKVHEMLNRIAISGGTFYNWIEAVYGQTPFRSAESPIYHGGLAKEIVFEEVVSTAETEIDGTNPLGTLGGKGRLSDKTKGGQVTIKVNEPSYIIGIVSITPRICYSQGNRWDSRLRTMDDFHKPNLNGIGFQDLPTEQLAWWDTFGVDDKNEEIKSAGKQVAWINYMSNVDRSHGHFADPNKNMFMTLNRRYSWDMEDGKWGIKDLTTYIEPDKYNYAFAMADLSAQNFWTQIRVKAQARRLVSAKQMPNL